MSRINWQRVREDMRGCMALGVAVLSMPIAAQVAADRVEGLKDNTPRWHAITGARLVTAPGKVIENATLVMRDGVIVAAGAGVAVPAGAREWNLAGRTVYAGFIDLDSSVGVPPALRPQPAPPPRFGLGSDLPPPTTPAPPEARLVAGRAIASRNAMVRAEQDLSQQLELKAEEIKAARELGFTSVLVTPGSGVFRGQSALINLKDGVDAKSMVVAARVAQHVANEVIRGNFNTYPNSKMGAIALVRQTFYDALWYRGATAGAGKGAAPHERPEANATLEALLPAVSGRQPVVYVAQDEQDYQGIARIRDEFKLRVLVLGNGHEYRRTQHLKAAGIPVIVPLEFPAPPEVENPDTALDSSLESLQHWEQAPSNLAYLEKANVEFSITAGGLRDAKKDFWPRMRESVKRGLSPDRALAALTSVPAKLIGESSRLGTLEPGAIANVVVASGDLFTNEKAQIELAFVDGRPYATDAFDRFDARGTWTVSHEGATATWSIAGTASKPKLAIGGADCDPILRGRQLVLRLPCGKGSAGEAQVIVAEGRGDRMAGSLQTARGAELPWSAVRTAPFTEAAPAAKPESPPPELRDTYPAGAFGISTPPRPAALLVRGATVWTSAAPGRLEGADLLVRDGKIAAVGRNLSAPEGALVIDAKGKHVTPGIIDAHSHTAIQGNVNESSSGVTAEVRIGDTLDATDVNIYRELAGGVTAANVLHGSANAIGGQSQVIKLRWGGDVEALKLEGAMPSVKFALGENVKRSNFATPGPARYPTTRMGVEQVFRDAFSSARRYRQEREEWSKSPRGRPEPRRDLQLDALVEVLEGRRVVHIHSYRADEILMFARLAKELGIKVAAFQHVLEGYKVADAIAGIGAGGSTFSDWWGYKMEVYDAIPYNGAMMQRAGVTTSFNSDSDELARRLNTEAAKAVKYGALSETQALAFVTINPARQLSIEARTGSLEPGKDADFVIWSGSPLSTASRAEQTWIEGRRYFDLARDTELREEAARERARLVAKALPARMAAMASAEAKAAERPAAVAAPAPRNDAREQVEYLELSRLVHDAARYRASYWTGASWDECTEDTP